MSTRPSYLMDYRVMGVGSMFLGILIYIFGRGDSSPVYQMIPASHLLEKSWVDIGTVGWFQDHPLFLYSLPDGLWMFSLMSVQLWIWDRKFTLWTGTWMAIVYSICLAFEFLQKTGISPGTYDTNDVQFMMVGGLLPILIEVTIQKSKKWKNTKTQ